jgi:excisionase family DNA binding protein
VDETPKQGPEILESLQPIREVLSILVQENRDLKEMLKELLKQRTVKDWYTTAEVAELLGKAEFTVREWCRNHRINAQKANSGRGQHPAWRISSSEVRRLEKEGLLPLGHQMRNGT